MAMSYTTLVADKSTSGSIKSWQNYSKIDSEGVLEEAQAMIYARLRVREMKTKDTFTVRVGAGYADLPDGFLQPLIVKDVTNDRELAFKEETELENMIVWTAGVMSTDEPCAYAVYDEQFNFDCLSRAAWKMRAVFYKTPDPLSTGNPRNFLTKRYPHLLRMACLATGARFAHDDDIWQREQKLLFNEIAELSIQDEMSGSTDVPVEI